MLTPLDVAMRMVCQGVTPVAPVHLPLDEALGLVAADMPPHPSALPPTSIAVTDGWALHARGIVGASSYAPLPMTIAPAWVEAGDRLPDGCDCVLDADLVDQTGPLFEILADAPPGHGIRRAGEDLAAGRTFITAGRVLSGLDVLNARAAGLAELLVRLPRVRVIDISAADGQTASSSFVAAFAEAAGARVIRALSGRSVPEISAALQAADSADLLLTVGGTGAGHIDAAIAALAQCGTVLAHGLTLAPGRTAAVGKVGDTPVIALPGAPDQALAVCLGLVQPVLDYLTARTARQPLHRRLARKIASPIGLTEIVLLESVAGNWMPLAAGQFSLEAMARADAWLAVSGESEGYAAGTDAGGFLLRDWM